MKHACCRKKILVTGASGLLGANIMYHIRFDRESPVVGVYHQHKFVMPGATTLQADLTDAAAAMDTIVKFKPDWIIHCAALSNVDKCELDPAEAKLLHETMTANLVSAALNCGAGLAYVSTDSVFDGSRGNCSETDTAYPLQEYGRTKLAGERIVEHGIRKHQIIRTNFFGWNLQNKLSLSEWMLSRMESGQSLPAFGDITCNSMLANHLAEALVEMVESDLLGTYHVGTSDYFTKYEFALQLREVFGFKNHPVENVSIDKNTSLKALRAKNTTLNTTKIADALKRPMPTLRDGFLELKRLQNTGFVQTLKSFLAQETP